MTLIYKPIPDEDAEAYHDLFNDEGLARNAGTVPHPVDLDWARERLASRREGERDGLMVDRGFYEDGVLVGSAGYFFRDDDLEIGYSVHRNARGRGLATRIGRMVVEMARKDRQTGPLVANHFTDNPASGRVLEKLGFRCVGDGFGTSAGRVEEGEIPMRRYELHDDIYLADPVEADYPTLFKWCDDPEAQYQAGAGAVHKTVEAMMAHHADAISKGAIVRMILIEGAVAGYMASFARDGKVEISYWLGRPFWGKGYATRALQAWLETMPVPEGGLYARVMKDHPASQAVLKKCGFEVIGEDCYHSDIRGGDVEEFVFKLAK